MTVVVNENVQRVLTESKPLVKIVETPVKVVENPVGTVRVAFGAPGTGMSQALADSLYTALVPGNATRNIIQASGDWPGLIVQAHASQDDVGAVGIMASGYNAAGTKVMNWHESGRWKLTVGQTVSDTFTATTAAWEMRMTDNVASNLTGVFSSITRTPVTPPGGGTYAMRAGLAISTSSMTSTWGPGNNEIAGMLSDVTVTGTGAQTIDAVMINFEATGTKGISAGTVTDVREFSTAPAGHHATVAGGTYTSWTNFWGEDPDGTGPTIGTRYGLRLKAITRGVTNWAIYSEGGDSSHAGSIRFGSNVAPTVTVDVTGKLLVGDTFTGSAAFYPINAAYTWQPTSTGAIATSAMKGAVTFSDASLPGNAATNVTGIDAFVVMNLTGGRAITGGIEGFGSTILITGTGTASPVQMYLAQPFVNTGATVTAFYGWRLAPTNLSGTIGTSYGMYLADWPAGTGTLTTQYGIYIENLIKGATNWALYSAGGQSSHAGSFRFGSNVAPTATVDITGTLKVSGATTIGSLAGYVKGTAGVLSAQAVPIPVADGGTNVTALSDVLGTTNQVSVLGGTARVIGGNVTISTPQDIHTAATPTFASLTLSGLTAGRVAYVGTAGLLSSSSTFQWDNTNQRLALTTAGLVGALQVQPKVSTDMGLILRGASSQSADILLVEDSGGVDTVRMSVNGRLCVNDAGSAAAIANNGMNLTYLFANPSGSVNAILLTNTVQPGAAQPNSSARGLNLTNTLDMANATGNNAGVIQGLNMVNNLSGSPGTPRTLSGSPTTVLGSGTLSGNTSVSGVWTFGFTATFAHTGTGTATDVRGFSIPSDPSGTGTITTLYGLYLANLTRGGTNWAIYSLGGQSSHAGSFRFGSNVAPTATVDITGTLLVSGNVGFFGTAAGARGAAYTQTYATASRTHAAFTSADLTGITSSTTGTALAEPSAGYVQAEHQQNYRRIQDQFNLLRADVANVKQVLNSSIDDDQAVGLKV